MKPLDIQAIARATGAKTAASGTLRAVVTDSREILPGCLFIALRGDRFDGHDYAAKALEAGASAVLLDHPVAGVPAERALLVEDTRTALRAIAALYRQNLAVKIVGVTGSVGKTTTKEMTALALSAQYKTAKSEANLNNEIGLSWSLLALTEEHQAAVLEMGMDGPGQIRPLSLCARPDAAIVTNIGVSHLEAMGSRAAIRDEKLAIGDGLADGAPLILCGDDELLRSVRSDRLHVLHFGIGNPACAVRAERIMEDSTGSTFKIRYDKEQYAARLPIAGRHNILNALAAFSAAICLGVPPEQAAAALGDYAPSGMRQRVRRHGDYTVVEDCYNASPDSMRAALTTFATMDCAGRRIAVLADMLELGAVAEQSHREVGALAAALDLDVLLCTGPQAIGYAQAARDAGMTDALHFAQQDKLFLWLKEHLCPGDTLWCKASRGMKLEDLIQRIYEEL